VAELTKSELAFLANHGISASDVFDACGKTTRQWKVEAETAGKNIVIGSPCKAAQHRLRTRAGHCVQCDTSKIAYQIRHKSPGYVYVAGSFSARVAKIGNAIDIQQRERNLRNQGYGGIKDWRILFHVRVRERGRVENDALKLLSEHRTTRAFDKDGHVVDAGEILTCSIMQAIDAVRASVGAEALGPEWQSLKLILYREL